MKRAKRVLIIRNYLPDDQPSMNYFADSLYRELSKKGWNMSEMIPWTFFGKFSFGNIFLEKWFGYLDKFILLPIRVWFSSSRYDLVHIIDHSYSWLSSLSPKNKHLVTCHDLIAIRSALGEFKEIHHTRWSGRMLQKIIMKGLRSARAVVCDCDNTRDDLQRLIPETKNRNWVVYLGVNRPFRRMEDFEVKKIISGKIIDKLANREVPYFFHVGIDSWYKNRRSLISAFIKLAERSNAHLILARGMVSQEEEKLIEGSPYRDRIHFVGRVTDEEIQALYSLACSLIFPSWIEGFGWPVVEAQSCGCPVVVSNREPIKKIAGESAILIDPSSIESIVEGMRSILFETSEKREARILAGYENIKYFSQERMIQDYDRLYCRLMGI